MISETDLSAFPAVWRAMNVGAKSEVAREAQPDHFEMAMIFAAYDLSWVVADLLMQLSDQNLRSQDRGSRLVAFHADLPESAALGFLHRRHGPVVDNRDIDAAEPGLQITHAAAGADQPHVTEQGGAAREEREVIVAACLLGQSAGQPALAHARGAGQEDVLITRHPTGVVGQGTHQGAIEAAGSAIVDVFDAGVTAAARPPRPCKLAEVVTSPLDGPGAALAPQESRCWQLRLSE